eukprot:RCo005445
MEVLAYRHVDQQHQYMTRTQTAELPKWVNAQHLASDAALLMAFHRERHEPLPAIPFFAERWWPCSAKVATECSQSHFQVPRKGTAEFPGKPRALCIGGKWSDDLPSGERSEACGRSAASPATVCERCPQWSLRVLSKAAPSAAKKSCSSRDHKAASPMNHQRKDSKDVIREGCRRRPRSPQLPVSPSASNPSRAVESQGCPQCGGAMMAVCSECGFKSCKAHAGQGAPCSGSPKYPTTQLASCACVFSSGSASALLTSDSGGVPS